MEKKLVSHSRSYWFSPKKTFRRTKATHHTTSDDNQRASPRIPQHQITTQSDAVTSCAAETGGGLGWSVCTTGTTQKPSRYVVFLMVTLRCALFVLRVIIYMFVYTLGTFFVIPMGQHGRAWYCWTVRKWRDATELCLHFHTCRMCLNRGAVSGVGRVGQVGAALLSPMTLTSCQR